MATDRGRLLLEGGFINFGLILDDVSPKNCSTKDWFTKKELCVINIRYSKKLPHSSRTGPGMSFAMVCPERVSAFHLWLWPHPLNRVCACVGLLFLSLSSRCSYYLRAATIQGATQINMVFVGGGGGGGRGGLCGKGYPPTPSLPPTTTIGWESIWSINSMLICCNAINTYANPGGKDRHKHVWITGGESTVIAHELFKALLQTAHFQFNEHSKIQGVASALHRFEPSAPRQQHPVVTIK